MEDGLGRRQQILPGQTHRFEKLSKNERPLARRRAALRPIHTVVAESFVDGYSPIRVPRSYEFGAELELIRRK